MTPTPTNIKTIQIWPNAGHSTPVTHQYQKSDLNTSVGSFHSVLLFDSLVTVKHTEEKSFIANLILKSTFILGLLVFIFGIFFLISFFFGRFLDLETYFQNIWEKIKNNRKALLNLWRAGRKLFNVILVGLLVVCGFVLNLCFQRQAFIAVFIPKKENMLGSIVYDLITTWPWLGCLATLMVAHFFWKTLNLSSRNVVIYNVFSALKTTLIFTSLNFIKFSIGLLIALWKTRIITRIT